MHTASAQTMHPLLRPTPWHLVQGLVLLLCLCAPHAGLRGAATAQSAVHFALYIYGAHPDQKVTPWGLRPSCLAVKDSPESAGGPRTHRVTCGHVTCTGRAASAVAAAAAESLRVSGSDPSGFPDPRTWVTGGPRGDMSAVWVGDARLRGRWRAVSPPCAGLPVSLGALGETKDPGSKLGGQEVPHPSPCLATFSKCPTVTPRHLWYSKGAGGRGPALGEDDDVGRTRPSCW